MKTLNKNQSVIVDDPRENDSWSHSFVGTIIQIKKDTYVVEDQDGDCFEPDHDQVKVL